MTKVMKGTGSRVAMAVLAAALTTTLAACGSSGKTTTGTTSGGKDASKATSAADLGGMDALVAAAEKEGQLNVIALPHDWANYGAILTAFKAKYPKITINEANPDGSSADELTAIKTLKGQKRAPDVVDVGLAFADQGAKAGQFAPYKVATWADIPDGLKDSTGLYYGDYGGYIGIGYDTSKVPTGPTSFKDLLDPKYKHQVALNGDPTKANAAFNGVWAAALANSGSLDNIQPGLDFFKNLNKEGNFVKVDATPATIESGQTPIVIDWDYLQAGNVKALQAKGRTWKVVVPTDAVIGGYYMQAVSATAPDPAAARLWEEFLYSDAGQNLWLQGGARPARQDAMTKSGTIDQTALKALPTVAGTPQFPTLAQITAAKNVVLQGWAKSLS